MFRGLPIVSIVVPFSGLPFRFLNIKLVKLKNGTTMETVGTANDKGVIGFRVAGRTREKASI